MSPPEENPPTCSLNSPDLQQRLAAIAEIGSNSLISRESQGDRHLLRFRAGGDTHRRLEAIVVAEAECCSFLDLTLIEESDELVLAIAAPADAQALADGLATAFAQPLGR